MTLLGTIFSRRAAGITVLALLTFGVIVTVLHQPTTAAAHSPHPGVDFSMGVDTGGSPADDCGTGVSQSSTCFVASGSTFTLNVYLNSFGDLPDYGAFDLYVEFSGIGSKANPDAHAWPDCGFEVTHTSTPGLVAWGCTVDVPPAPDSTYTGLIGTSDFNCTANGIVTMIHGGDNIGEPTEPQRTFLADRGTENHAEGQLTSESLNIVCGEQPPVGGVAWEGAPWHASGLLGVSFFGWLSAAFSLLMAGVLAWQFRAKQTG